MKNTYPMRVSIRAQAAGEATRLDIYDDIGAGGGEWFDEGLTAKAFSAQLAKVAGPLDVHINSAGGSVDDGIAINNNIRNYKGYKRTVVDGMAASIASVIFQAGDERVVEPGGMVFVHDAHGMCIGNAAEMAKFSDDLDKHSDNIAKKYADRAGGTVDQWRDTMRTEKWYDAEEAVAAGLADRVGDVAAQLPADLDLAAFTAIPGQIAARLRTLPATWAPGGKVQAKAPDAAADAALAAAGAPVSADGTHAPFSGSHAHAHTANGDQGGDVTHDHDHDHAGDADHAHSDGVQAKAPKPAGKKAARKKARAEAAGACCSVCGPDCACGGQPAAHGRVTVAVTRRRVLGAESMPLLNEALPVHHTGTVDEPWDGPKAVAGMPNNAKTLRYCHAWQDTGSDDGTSDDPDGDADDKKASYKFPHHTGKGSAANLAACRNGLRRLSGADIPDSDRAGVQKHLQAHLDDGASGDDAGNHAHTDLAGFALDEIRAALKGAHS